MNSGIVSPGIVTTRCATQDPAEKDLNAVTLEVSNSDALFKSVTFTGKSFQKRFTGLPFTDLHRAAHTLIPGNLPRNLPNVILYIVGFKGVSL